MSRIGSLAVVVAFLLAGLCPGQPPAPPSASTPATDPAPSPSAGASMSPGTAPTHIPNGTWEATPPCDVGRRLWANADFLLGWVKTDRVPALVTTSPPNTPVAAAGVLGVPTTQILFGSAPVNTKLRTGVRAELGTWLDSAGTWAVEAGFFVLESDSTSFLAVSDGSTILARPFFDVTTGAGSSVVVALPGTSAGSVQASVSARNFYGANLDLRETLYAGPNGRLGALVGYRFLRYDERLQVQHQIQPTSGLFVPGTMLTATDSFSTRNLFHGLDLGLRTDLYYGPLSVELLGKVAVGYLRRTATILGSQQVNVPGDDPVNRVGGLLALSSNIGTRSRHVWTGVPELGATISWQLTPNLSLRAGYSILWFFNPFRPGEQIDLGVNPNLIPPSAPGAGATARPAFTGPGSDLWLQTASVGLEVRY